VNALKHVIKASFLVVAALPVGILWINAQQTTTTQPKTPTKIPKWLASELAAKNLELAPACKFQSGYTATDVGRGRGTSEGHCYLNCYAKPLTIAPSLGFAKNCEMVHAIQRDDAEVVPRCFGEVHIVVHAR
jgi:hypothetical protein